MKDLILRIRSEMLKTNITRVREKVKKLSAPDRYGEIGRLSDSFVDLLDALHTTLGEMNTARLKRKLEMPGPLADQVHSAFDQVNALYESYNKVQAELKNLRESAIPYNIPARQDAGQLPEACIIKLGSIAEALDGIKPDRDAAWSSYQEKYADVRLLFSEYLEFMSGLALRDAGLDEGMCDLAEELIRTYRLNDHNYEFLSIPGRLGAVRVTWARVIRMGFPEWTIWALPLTAHDIWFELAREDVDARETLGQIDVSSPDIQECMAEAFALWLTGPAYAYAAFFLRLDPFTAHQTGEHQATDEARAYAIQKMWELMDKAEPDNRPYSSHRKDLDDEWNQSIQFAKPVGGLAPEVKDNLDKTIPALFDRLHNKTYGGYNTTAWSRIQMWPEAILNDSPVSVAGAEYRDVLNAVWLARIREPGQYLLIEDRARKLWDQIRHERDKAAVAGNRLQSRSRRL
jgi:hypothetical protein